MADTHDTDPALQPRHPLTKQPMLPCRLIRVHDGDCVSVELLAPAPPITLKIRLADIDAPERGELAWTDARTTLGSLCTSGPLAVELADNQPMNSAGYNRTPAYLWSGHLLVNEVMVETGYAVAWSPKGRGQHAARIEAAEQLARDLKLGIWSIGGHRLQLVYQTARR